MRHVDEPELIERIHLPVTPELVWPVISDITLPVGPSAELQAVRWTDPGDGPSVGRRFVGTNRNRHFGEWQMTCTVVECEPPKVFGWVAGAVDEPATSWRFCVEADAGGSIVSQWMRLGTGESGLSVAIRRMPDKEERIVERRLEEFRAGMVANLEAVRAAVCGP